MVILSAYAKRNELRIYHWVLMPNHYHLLLELDEPRKLSSIMAGIGRSYVHYHHKTYQSAGHLWQDRFKSQPVDKEMYLLACGRYIERNPVKAKIVRYAEDYAYSSAAYYVSGKDDALTQGNLLFDSFESQSSQRREEYKEFLRDFDQEEEELFVDLEYPQGSKEFVNRLIKKKGLFLPRRRGRPSK
ncbi:MAG: hypothetical protein SCARUB_03037 [Candidatus Scalindua rubra]|uniref:Transposase IS200-like domain-containing protein n=1 Tax=Candidatus Scalindua rubra TaxID=1872076 RepID=A0A1E3X859_9BACT|nr:MAG: hypothetical protein SCARUB_03037 [Candidatus Scalindua rubra]